MADTYNTNTNVPGVLGFFQAREPVSQLVLAVLLATVLYIILISLEAIYLSYKSVSATKVTVNNKTFTSDSGIEYTQNPNLAGCNSASQPMCKTLLFSDNERTGIEYSYSIFLFLKENTFGNDSKLKHIMHKGYKTCVPLMSPGIFVHANTNTLRVYQSSTRIWNNFVDIDNIPVNKWFHLVVLARANAVEIYVNGNLASKLNMGNAVIYQNYQSLRLFQKNTERLTATSVPSVAPQTDFWVEGSADAFGSRLNYFSYALSYTEIQDLMNEGPSTEIDDRGKVLPPYLLDNWWTGQNLLM